MAESLFLPAWFQEFAGDGIAFIASVLLVAGYYYYLNRQGQKNPTYSIHAVNALARRMWTENVMTNTGKDIMAVQTLRNFIMVSIMMATTASMLIVGTLTLSSQAENITRSWHVMGMLGSHSAGLWIFKVLCLLVDFITAFFAYAMSMRLSTHVLFMINVPQDSYRIYPELAPNQVANRLIQAGNLIAMGMRAFLFAIPLVFWLFGPIFLLLATAGLVITLHRIDRHEAAGLSNDEQPRDDRASAPEVALAQEHSNTVAFRRSTSA
jgi:uncharacterized membrane protein